MKNSLYSLAEEYDEAIKKTKAITDKTRLEMKQAQTDRNEDKCRLLKRKLEVCYEEIRDMRIISDTLKNYYKNDNNRAFPTEAAV